MTISKSIRAQIDQRPFGELITALGLLELGLGTRSAIDQTLSRLCRSGFIKRIARGVYAKPQSTRFGGSILPDANQITAAFARLRGITLQPHGAEAVRRLGLSTQMPARSTFLTDGPNRTLHIGALKIRLEHAPKRMLLLAGCLAGLAISALFYMGRREATPETIKAILLKLPISERQALLASRSRLPKWLRISFDQAEASVNKPS